MSLIDKVRGVAAKKSQSAREVYHAALRRGEPEKIIAAADAAGVDSAAVERDVAVLEKAEALGADARRLPELEKAAATAKAAAEKAANELDAAVARLEPIANAAVFDSGVADRAVSEARAVVVQLVGLHRDNPALLPLDSMPDAVQKVVRAEDASRTDSQVRAAAEKRRAECVRAIQQLQDRRADIQQQRVPLNSMIDVSILDTPSKQDAALKSLDGQIVVWQEELSKAQAQAEAVGS